MAKTQIDTVVMSGGAPQSPLMAGFLYALLKEGKTFKNFHTSGAGALMALLLIAPRNGDPCQALKNWVEAGVVDDIFRLLPVNFKLFRKPGPFAALFHQLAQRFKVPLAGDVSTDSSDAIRALLAEWLATPRLDRSGSLSDRDPIDRLEERVLNFWRGMSDPQLRSELLSKKDPIKRLRDTWLATWLKTDADKRLYNDLVELWFSALAPSTLTPASKGMAAPLPFLEELVDFSELRKFGGHLCVNAYNITEDAKLTKEERQDRTARNAKVMKIFDQSQIDGPHVRAAFSMPFIYPPAQIDGDDYSEGADHQPINFHTLLDPATKDTVVVLDVLAELEDELVRTPRDLWDAYVISIMTPVVALAHQEIDDFVQEHPNVNLIKAEWDIPPAARPFVMDWSRSNLSMLFDAGRRAGEVFLSGDDKHEAHGDELLNYKDVFKKNPPRCP